MKRLKQKQASLKPTPKWPPKELWIVIGTAITVIIIGVAGTLLIYKDHPDIPTEVTIVTAIIIGLPGLVFAYLQWYYPRPTADHDPLAHPYTRQNHYQSLEQTPTVATQTSPIADATSYPSSFNTSPLTLTSQPLPPSLIQPLPVNPTHSAKGGGGPIDSIFHFNVPLPTATEFYGRLSERETLINRTYSHASTSIIGMRRIGKTWLLQYLRLSARSKLGSRFRIGFLNATSPSCVTVAGFTQEVLKSFHADLPRHPSDLSLDLTALEDYVKISKQTNYSPVLCIDEFDSFGERAAFDLNFFKGMRAIAETGLVLILASRMPLIDIVGEPGKTSGFFNIFEQLTLEAFHRREAEIFVQAKSAQAGFTVQEQLFLLEYGQTNQGQWPPMRLQLVGKELFIDKKLAERDDPFYYRPNDAEYWEKFEEKLERKYKGVAQK